MNQFSDENKVKIYGASVLSLALKWLAWEQQYPNVEWTARWPFLIVNGISQNSPSMCKMGWERDLEDISRSDVVVLFSNGESDLLRGALVEAGAALGQGKPVILVGGEREVWDLAMA